MNVSNYLTRSVHTVDGIDEIVNYKYFRRAT